MEFRIYEPFYLVPIKEDSEVRIPRYVNINAVSKSVPAKIRTDDEVSGYSGFGLYDCRDVWHMKLKGSILEIIRATGLPFMCRVRLEHNGVYCADDISKLMTEKVLFVFKLNLTLSLMVSVALMLVIAWRRTIDRPISWPMMVRITGAYTVTICKVTHYLAILPSAIVVLVL